MRRIVLFLLAASTAFGQLDSNVVTISVSRQLYVQPDEVSLTVYVTSPSDQTLDQVLAALKDTKIKASDLTNFYTQGTALTWVFGPVLPFSDMKGVLPALEALEGGAPIGVQLYFVNTAVSAQAAASQQCPYPALINDARLQGGKLATAAGGTVGAIVSIASGTAATVAVRDPLTAQVVLSGEFSGYLIPNPWFDTFYIQTPSTCALTVQFQLRQ